ATQWGAAVEIDATEPAVTLRWLSAERTKNPPESEPLRVRIDLRRQRVTSPHLPGSTSLGMLQALVRRVRGLKWLEEELPAWLAKGAGVPAP
ncbi:MAG TPA: hypothetical protein VHF69_05800, partial [Candidatus Synoicihabitans sp.]|nr:hypothetical protein [Candidatus Synoicihabitans sp.]